jgi:PAS domain S-box-containing protein
LSQGKILRISKAEDIPKEAVAERQYMKSQGFKAFLTIPMIISESVIGAISYSDTQQEREWSDQLISQLRVLTEIFANVLKRRQTEKKLHESEERYRSLVNESPAAILVFQDGHFIFTNPAGLRLLGCSDLKDFVGRPALDFIPPTLRDPMVQRMENLAQGESNPTVEIELLKTDGTIISVETTSVPIQIGGNPAGLIICNDITQRKLAEMELLKSQENFRNLAGKLLSVQEAERRRLAREMHDDLTQHLAVLAIEIGKMERKFQDSEDPVLETFRSIRERLVNLSGDVHAISRQLHPSIIDDLGLVDAIKSECRTFTRREGIAIDYRSESMPPRISADVAICIYRIVQEGLRNVAKHADTTQLQISLTGKDDSIHLTIKDQGVGFDPKEIKKKLGLGHVSMQERVRLIQGDISIESRPGKGTVINVRAPADP